MRISCPGRATELEQVELRQRTEEVAELKQNGHGLPSQEREDWINTVEKLNHWMLILLESWVCQEVQYD